jgi:predicted AAA+ superfamily ATPase
MNPLIRILKNRIKERLKPNKVIVLYGARRVGKTVLLKSLASEINPTELLFLNGEDQFTISILENRSIANYQRLTNGKKYLFIDEAQNIPDIGKKLKLMVDEIEGLHIVVTGSSVFDLTNKLGEPLVGRQLEFHLYPLSQIELSKYENVVETYSNLEYRLIYGGYPELLHIKTIEEKQEYLEGVVNGYLLKDILTFNGIKKADKLMDLLRLVALQIGHEVSIDELASNLKGVSRNTVETYLDLLEKVFVIYKVGGFSKNLRKEIVKTSRYYFYDNGIRNAIIKNFNPLEFRMDVGQLWENYLMIERRKKNHYTNLRVNSYFWRTYDRQEIDLIEEKSQELSGYEFKWNPKKTPKSPTAWKKNYPDASFEVINKDNFLLFIT